MFLRELMQPVTLLRGAGKATAEKLARLGIFSVADLLLHYPRDYDDRSVFIGFSSFARERVHTVAEVIAHDWFGFEQTRTLKITLRDESGPATLICFNRPFLEQSLPVGSRVLVTGRFQYRYGEIQSSSFEVESLRGGKRPLAAILPVYALTESLKQGTMRRLVKAALTEYGSKIEQELPSALAARLGLLSKREALRGIHAPRGAEELARSRAALVFEELFYFQAAVARRSLRRRETTIPRRACAGLLRARLIERLPFALSPDQRRAVDEIAADLRSPRPMARLLQGDVGSGKTLVALLACLETIEAGGQAAIMAPTELLARQHAATAARLVEPLGLRLAFLSGNVTEAGRGPLLRALAEGQVDLVIGTQALFSDDVEYRDLRLAVVDEQHRFGVLQRLALGRKGRMPDLLMMSATPIPRSLALTVYGDLALSEIRTMPPGRKPIITHLSRMGNEQKVYDFVGRLLDEGRQAYFVYPLIGDSRKLELKNAKAMAENLAVNIFRGRRVGLIHSRLKEEHKRAAMDAFARGELDILVATSVVEVGIDVANAAAMVIEQAERFGLAALHQLRGRVGRGPHQSYCFLVYSGTITEDAKTRLKAMLASNDGFALAEEDLRIRGPGELVGTAQSGNFRLSIADPLRDQKALELARREAFALVETDPGFLSPDNAVIAKVLERTNPFGEKTAGQG